MVVVGPDLSGGLLRALAAGLLLAATGALRAEAFDGWVTRVSDGDTLWVAPQREDGRRGRPVKLRLVGLDAPERCQAHGEAARAALAGWVLKQRVQVDRGARDVYGRPLVTLRLAGEDLGARLVRQGHAWSARYRDDPGPYAREEAAARAARRGLFADPAAERPRDFRKRHGPCPSEAPRP